MREKADGEGQVAKSEWRRMGGFLVARDRPGKELTECNRLLR